VAQSPILARVLALASRLPGAQRLPPDPGSETPLANGGFWLDSVALLELIVACEEAFGICLDPAELTPDRLESAGSLAALIEARMRAAPERAGR
jgi:acyl carrier protein